jgi:hypothetical protein
MVSVLVRCCPGSSLEWDPSNLTPFIAAGDFVSPKSETPTLPRPIRHLKNFDQTRIKAANQNPNEFLEPFFETFQAYFCNCTAYSAIEDQHSLTKHDDLAPCEVARFDQVL